MATLSAFWLPILVSAVLVFIASSIIHMFLPYHRSDYEAVPQEDRVADALREAGVTPGQYIIPHAASAQAMKDPEYQTKRQKGPVAFINVHAPGGASMGQNLMLWFVFLLVVGYFAAYVTGRALSPQSEYLEVFRFAGATAFACYGIGLWPNAIWYTRAWSSALKSTFDGLVYALLTAGVFGWLWP